MIAQQLMLGREGGRPIRIGRVNKLEGCEVTIIEASLC